MFHIFRTSGSDKRATTADSWSFWLMYLGPILLARKFVRRVYYDHFVDFVLLIHKFMQFENLCSLRWIEQMLKLFVRDLQSVAKWVKNMKSMYSPISMTPSLSVGWASIEV
jgi:hypothetical protein